MSHSVLRSLRNEVRGQLKEAMCWPHAWRDLNGIEKRNPILVYQMGKVGSSSVVATIRAIGSNDVAHVHSLTQPEVERARLRQRTSASRFLPEHLIVSSILVRKLRRGRFPFRVVTLTREPVARAISHVFEANKQKLADAWRAGNSFTAREAERAVLEMLRGENGIADPGIWFENELRTTTGIDVFSKPYDHERGFTLFEDTEHPVLLVRMEDLDRGLNPGLSALLGSPALDGVPDNANVGHSKWYGSTLKQVKQHLKLPPELADRVFGTRYFRHFYGPEAEALRRRWS